MVNVNNMMFIRPKNCHDCGNGYNGLNHVVQYAQNKGLWNIIDLSADEANKDPVYQAINNTDPFGIYGFGHGSDCRYTGDLEEDIFTCSECGNLNGRIIYLLSCLTGNSLGPAIIQNGGAAYAGYNISWTWITEGTTEGDPYIDKYGKCFWESGNELWIALCDGYEFMEAIDKIIEKYNQWIDYWFYTNPDDDYAEECIMWLAYDRDGLIAYNECMLKQTQQECQNAGCYWYNNICNSREPTKSTFNLIPLIPVIAVIGIAFIVGMKKYK